MSNYKIFRMRRTGITLKNYPVYLNYRRKRLNISQIMFIDTLAIIESPEK